MQFPKVLKPLLIVGLLIILFLLNRQPMGLKTKAIILLSKYRALYPYVVAQAKLETANFTSNVFLKNKNYFGMKMPRVRPTVAIAGGLKAPSNEGATPYANYASESDSVTDLMLWFDYTKFPTSVNSVDDYARELKKRNFFGSTEISYVKNLKFWLT